MCAFKSTFQIWCCSRVYLVVEQLSVVSQPRHHLSLGAAVVVSLSFSYLAQLFVQGFFLQLELLGVACLHPQLSLQSPHHPVFCLQLIHLQGLRVTRWWTMEQATESDSFTVNPSSNPCYSLQKILLMIPFSSDISKCFRRNINMWFHSSENDPDLYISLVLPPMCLSLMKFDFVLSVSVWYEVFSPTSHSFRHQSNNAYTQESREENDGLTVFWIFKNVL